MDGSYALSVDLGDVGEPLCQDVTWHLIAILVSELGSFTLGTLSECPCIGDGARHNAANGRGDLEDVRHGGRVDQFVLARGSALIERRCCRWVQATYGDLLLRQDDGAILAPDTYRHDVCGGDSLEGIFCRHKQR